jgi:two-component system sensor histidine kinase UhpB
VLAVALVALASTPLTVSWPANLRSAVVLGVAVGGTMAVQALLARRVLAPLGALWQHMQTVDPLHPGHRIEVEARSIEVADLVDAFNGMLDRLEEERRQSARRTEAAQEAERRWLSLELHDQIGQDLTAVLLGIGVARRLEGDRQAAALENALTTTQDCLERVRAVVSRLRPAALDELGLISALVHLCDRSAAAGIPRLDRSFDLEIPRLTTDAELGVYRVAQESLTNVLRHSGATHVALTLSPHDGGVRLCVADDGVGLPQTPDATAGSGIRGMRERALLLGATLEITSRVPRGTQVTLDVPASETLRTSPDEPSSDHPTALMTGAGVAVHSHRTPRKAS